MTVVFYSDIPKIRQTQIKEGKYMGLEIREIMWKSASMKLSEIEQAGWEGELSRW
jgi:hypothetical protein